MSEKKIGSVIVNDENGQVLGIFTVTDTLSVLIEIARESGEISSTLAPCSRARFSLD